MGRIEVGRSTVYLYVENITAMLLGYAYWFILSRVTTPEIIGISSTLTSFAAIFATIASIGMPIGVQRLLGNMYFERKFEDIKVLVKASLIILCIGITGCSIFILIAKNWLFSSVDSNLIVVSLLLTGSIAVSVLFRYIVIASLKTKRLLIFSFCSAIVKLIITIILVFGGTNAIGIMIGYSLSPILISILLAFTIREFFKQYEEKPIIHLYYYFRKLLSVSMASWIPLLVNTVGSQLGTIVTFGFQGAGQAGFYFISFQIYTAISAVIWALESTTYPVLSSMDNDDRKKVSWRLMKISMIITLPFSYSVIFYSNDIMQLFGDGYSEGSLSLQILTISIVPVTLMAGITTLLYLRENYRTILVIELATSIPRTLLYFVLVPIYTNSGAALSFTIGSFIGLIISIWVSKEIKMYIPWKDLVVMNIIPLGVVFILLNTGVNFAIGILLSISISYLFFLKFRILSRKDVHDSLDVLPSGIGNPIIRIVDIIGKKLNRSY
jgi:O-antigen/teichoic acid export membrane protein